MPAPCSPGPFANGGPAASTSALKSIQNSQKSNSVSLASSTTGSRESSATPVHMMHRRMSTPRVESPRLDSYRYSLINLEETLENDLGRCNGAKAFLNSYTYTILQIAFHFLCIQTKATQFGYSENAKNIKQNHQKILTLTKYFQIEICEDEGANSGLLSLI